MFHVRPDFEQMKKELTDLGADYVIPETAFADPAKVKAMLAVCRCFLSIQSIALK